MGEEAQQKEEQERTLLERISALEVQQTKADQEQHLLQHKLDQAAEATKVPQFHCPSPYCSRSVSLCYLLCFLPCSGILLQLISNTSDSIGT